MNETLVLSCKVSDYDAATGVCAAPFYSNPPGVFPALTLEQGAVIAFGIVGVWTVGLVAKLFIRASKVA
jgi:hypothetical protein